MTRVLLIALGGALGTLARYGIALVCEQRLGTAFPYGTLVVNAFGSFALGVVMHVGLATELLSPTMRLALGTGLMGGFTTYSTFNYETLKLADEGAWTIALVNVAVTLVGCLAAGLLGLAAAKRLLSG